MIQQFLHHLTEQTLTPFLQEGPAWLQEQRKRAFKTLTELPLPSFKHGLSILIKPAYDFSSLQPSVESIETISSESSDIRQGLTDAFQAMQSPPKNALEAFHQTFVNDFLHIEVKTSSEDPLKIMTNNQATQVSDVLITTLPDTHARIILHRKGTGYISERVHAIVAPQSSVEIITIQEAEELILQKRTSEIGKDAKIQWTDLCVGGSYCRNETVNHLQAEGADGNITILFKSAGTQRQDIYTASIHEAPDTTSNIITRGIATGSAKALSRGLVRIEEKAAGSNGYETQDVLLLSSEAEADAIPNLEIHNHDVKCSHGSTVGQIDKEQLFYLQSRGLSHAEATTKIVEGYFAPVLDKIDDKLLKERLMDSLASLGDSA